MVQSSAETENGKAFPLTEFHLGIEGAITKLNGRIKHCGRHAFAHLRAAWKIKDADPEMSALRAITAEEEAASALLLALKEKRYPGAEYLDHRKHIHKIALTPFINAVRKVMEAIDFASPVVRLHDTTPPSISVQIDMNKVGLKTSEPLYGSPDQPLNFSIALGEDRQKPHTFDVELQEIAKQRGVEKIIDFIRDEANQRNLLLYAGDTGIPHVKFADGFLLERLRRVSVLLLITIAIQQTSIHQLFVMQCLRSFLLALRKINIENFDFECPSLVDGPSVEIAVDQYGEPRTSLAWRTTVPFRGMFGYAFGRPPTIVTPPQAGWWGTTFYPSVISQG